MSFVRQIGAHASEDRLEKLLAERLKYSGGKEAIDQRIWDLFGEEWAIMFSDLSGFSRNVEKFGIIHFLQTIQESLRILVPCIDQHDGILLKVEGDSMLVIFRHSQRAIECAIDMQKATADYNVGRQKEDEILLCLGIGYGKVLRIGDNDVFGHEVNCSAKLGEDIAKANEILVTEPVMKVATEKMGLKCCEIDTEKGFLKGYRLEYRQQNPRSSEGV